MKTNVDPDVVTIRGITVINDSPRFMDQVPDRRNLVKGCIKEVREMPEGNDEDMAGAHGIRIVPGIGQCVLNQDLLFFRGAEDAGG